MSVVDSSLPSSSQINQISQTERYYSAKERMIKLVQAVAIVVFSIGVALFFASIRQMLKDAWIGKKIEYSTDQSTPVIRNFSEKSNKLTLTDIHLLFSELEDETQAIPYAYTSQPISRFADISCPRDTVVQVGESAIHGNWIRMPDDNTYIATQAPVPQDYGHFWQVAFENEGFIVDLTTPNDQIAPYAPNEGVKNYGDCTVELVEEQILLENVSLRTYNVIVDEQNKQVQRIHFNAWIDHSDTSVDTLIHLAVFIQNQQKSRKTPIIHCRAGVGRTGTLISVTVLRNLLKKGIITKDNINEKIKDVILTGRRCRGPYFVQKNNQLDVIKSAMIV